MPGRLFPDTRPSVVRDALGSDAAGRTRARDEIAQAYWSPIHAYLCRRWRLDDHEARDLTQEFFAQALTRELFHRYDPARSRFRTYVRLCVDSFVRNWWKAEGRQKRGAHQAFVQVDDIVDTIPSSDWADAESAFEREWLRALFGRAIDILRDECTQSGKEVHFSVLSRYDIEGADAETRPSYANIAAEFNLPITQVTNYLAWARRRLRAQVLHVLREQCSDDAEFRTEAQALFGVTA